MNQKDLSEEMIKKGIERFRRSYQKSIDKGYRVGTKPGAILLKRMILTASNALTKWIKDSKGKAGFYKEVRPYITTLCPDKRSIYRTCTEVCKVIINHLDQDTKFTNLASNIGRSIEDEAFINRLKVENKKEWRIAFTKKVCSKMTRKTLLKIFAKHNVKDWIDIPNKIIIEIGALFILMFEESGLLECRKKMIGAKRVVRMVYGSDATMKWLAQTEESMQFRFPFYMPCLDTPKDWTNIFDGGYPEGVFNKPLVKVDIPEHRDLINQENMPEFYKSVNCLQKVGYRVNVNVLEVIKHFFNNQIPLSILPTADKEPLPAFPEEANTNEELKIKWKREAAKIHNRNYLNIQKKVILSKLIGLASKFQGHDFYYPIRSDFRGRLYTSPQYLTFQSEDISRSLVVFADSKPINNDEEAKWLYIHNANVWGHDKLTLEDRLQWTKDNTKLIRAISQDPIGNLEWTTADKPFQALAAAFELDQYLDAKESKQVFHTHLPIWIDGSNNGLQLFSLLTKDIEGAKATNVLPTDKPDDIYRRVSDRLIEYLKTQDNEIARFWLSFGIDRKTTKKVVMTVPYGVSPHSARDYIKEWYEDQCEKRKITPLTPGTAFIYSAYLSSNILKIIKEIVSGAISTMNWLREVASILTKQNIELKWTSPSGFICRQASYSIESRSIKLSYGDKVYGINIGTNTDKLSNRKQMSGISPNYIHSIDASILHLLINNLFDNGIKTVATIHDSFATLSPDIDKLTKILLSTIHSIFKEDLLLKFKKEIEGNHNVKLPEIPKYGDLNIDDVLNSRYLFT